MANIYLVGIMGVGKTTIGRKLASLLDKPFVDTDQELEKRTGVTISHIFDIEGEEGFRLRETNLLQQLSREFDGVVATGGGIVVVEENRKLLQASGQVIYLKASFSVLWRRLKNNNKRPLLQTQDPKARLQELIASRGPLYQSVNDYEITVGKGSAIATAKRIKQQICENT